MSENAQKLPEAPLISKHELSIRLGKHYKTIERWMKDGLIPYYQAEPGADVMFDYEEVRAALRKGPQSINQKQAVAA